MIVERNITALVLGLAMLLCCAGCQEPVGEISGVVTAYNPRTKQQDPISFGRITFHNVDKKAVSHASIEQGIYAAANVPVGVATVTISSFNLAYQEGGDISGFDDRSFTKVPYDAAAYFAIDPRFASLKESPLSFDVKQGKQVHNIELSENR